MSASPLIALEIKADLNLRRPDNGSLLMLRCGNNTSYDCCGEQLNIRGSDDIIEKVEVKGFAF